MDKKEKNFATYKEFAKMLREVANIYSKLGDEPLLKEGYEYNAIRDAVQYVTNKHDFGYFIQPWKDEFLRMPFDVTKRKKWADYVAECHATGKEIDYDNYDWDKCTAFSAAPFLIWSPTNQKVRPFSLARSLRTRPTYTSSFPARNNGIG